MNELSFLVNLLTKHKLDDETKDAVASRLIEVSEAWPAKSLVPPPVVVAPSPAMVGQAPSMQAIMARNPDLVAQTPPVPVEHIAQTPATAAALASRSQAMLGVTDPATGRKRKF